MSIDNWINIVELLPGDWSLGWGVIIAIDNTDYNAGRRRITFLGNGETTVYTHEFSFDNGINIIRRGE